MFKKIIVLCLSLVSISSIAAPNYDIQIWKEKYINLDEEGKEDIKETLSSKGWISVSRSREYETLINFNYVEALPNGLTQAWLKHVVVNDISKDGLALGDHTMVLSQFNCKNKTEKSVSYTDYDAKTGQSKRSYTYPSYTEMKPPVPDSVGESQLESVCFFSYVKTH